MLFSGVLLGDLDLFFRLLLFFTFKDLVVLGLNLREELCHLGVGFHPFVSDSCKLHSRFDLGGRLTFRKRKYGLCHPVGCFDILRVVIENFLTLVYNMVELLHVELAEGKVGSTSHLALFGDLGVSEVLVEPDRINC